MYKFRNDHASSFGSRFIPQKVFQLVRKLITERKDLAQTQRLRYLLMDFEQADGIDFSAAAVLLEAVRYLRTQNILGIVFTGMSTKTHQRLRRERVLDFTTSSFETLDIGLEFIEEQLLEHSNKVGTPCRFSHVCAHFSSLPSLLSFFFSSFALLFFCFLPFSVYLSFCFLFIIII